MSTTKEKIMEQTKQETSDVLDYVVSNDDLQNVVENEFSRILSILFNAEGTFYLTQKCDGNTCKTEYINLLDLSHKELTMLAICELRRRSAIVLRDSKDGKISVSIYQNAQKETQQYNGKELSEKKKRVSVDSLSNKMSELFLQRRAGTIDDTQFADAIDMLEFEYAPKED